MGLNRDVPEKNMMAKKSWTDFDSCQGITILARRACRPRARGGAISTSRRVTSYRRNCCSIVAVWREPIEIMASSRRVGRPCIVSCIFGTLPRCSLTRFLAAIVVTGCGSVAGGTLSRPLSGAPDAASVADVALPRPRRVIVFVWDGLRPDWSMPPIRRAWRRWQVKASGSTTTTRPIPPSP